MLRDGGDESIAFNDIAVGSVLRGGSGTRYQRRSAFKLSVLDLPYLPEEMRDVLPGDDPVALTRH